MATRPVVHRFIDDLCRLVKKEVRVHHETTVRATDNRPDWRIEDPETFGVYAYGDHKSLLPDAPFQLSPSDRRQMTGYLSLGRPLFVFDGIEFLIFRDSIDKPRRLSLVEKPVAPTQDWSTLKVNPLVEAAFREILMKPGFRTWSEEELIEQLANRARLLSQSIELLLRAPAGSGSDATEEALIQSLHKLWQIVRKHHDPALAVERACADFVAQVLAFGLFFAHTHAPAVNDPDERRRHIQEFWNTPSAIGEATRLRPFHTIATLLNDSLESENDLAAWYREQTMVLAHAEYMGRAGRPGDFHVLFEKFLGAFDRVTKFERGAFYTPAVLTCWMARTTDELVRHHFGGRSVVELADTVIDPCCGTGGFLEAMLELTRTGEGRLPLFVGFEILPAPYALAHYRLDRVIAGGNGGDRVRILLTDTLSNHLLSPPPLGRDGFSEELREANEIARTPLRIVIGNPPSSRHVVSGAPRSQIERALDDFRPPAAKRSERQNVQQALNNEAYRFLRWCAQKVIDSGAGVLSVVLPGAFAYAVSFAYARKWILDHFHSVHVLVLDQDARTGAPTNSLFNVQQGRLVLFAVLRATDGAATRTVDFLDI